MTDTSAADERGKEGTNHGEEGADREGKVKASVEGEEGLPVSGFTVGQKSAARVVVTIFNKINTSGLLESVTSLSGFIPFLSLIPHGPVKASVAARNNQAETTGAHNGNAHAGLHLFGVLHPQSFILLIIIAELR